MPSQVPASTMNSAAAPAHTPTSRGSEPDPAGALRPGAGPARSQR